jgi:murein DD-endopeptidase MepM/ murein hydrolase activator NlpD
MHIKRGLFWLWNIIWPFFQKVGKLYHDTVGFYLYKAFFSLARKIQIFLEPWRNSVVDAFGKRSTLQFVLLAIGIIVMVPHTKLYSQDVIGVPGQKTLLYSLVGPGDLDFAIEEVEIDVTTLGRSDARPWTEGAVVSQPALVSPNDPIILPQEITSISAGGSALSKPTIISGDAVVTLPTGETGSTNRTKTVTHKVQSGDTIGAIAERYGISVETILWANNLSARSYIRPGDDLKILPASGVLHKVKRGESVNRIAKLYDVEAEEIIDENRLQNDGSDIVIGEELLVPGARKQSSRVVSASRRSSAFSGVAAPPPSASAPAGSGYLWPTNVRRITQYYGWRHTGLDIGGPVGSPLYASKGGRVIRSQCGWNGGYGCYVIIDHGGGVQTLYAHATRLHVSVGQQVRQGQTIALMGSTGRSTGPHIHYEVRVNGRRQNPLRYIR